MSTDPIASQNERVDWVDYAKGICIILVVMMHTVYGVEHVLDGQGWMHAVVDFARPFRMPDFFLVAGLFLSRSIHGPLLDYVDRKVVHFIYFYVLWLALQFPVVEYETLVAHPAYALKLWAFSFIEPSNSLWFVHMLAIFYVVTRLVRHLPVWMVFAGAFLLQSLYQLGFIDTGFSVIDRFANRYVYFFMGYAFAPQIFRFAGRAAQAPLAGLVGLLVWAGMNWWAVTLGLQEEFLTSFLLGMAGATAVCVASAPADPVPDGGLPALLRQALHRYLSQLCLPIARHRSARPAAHGRAVGRDRLDQRSHTSGGGRPAAGLPCADPQHALAHSVRASGMGQPCRQPPRPSAGCAAGEMIRH